VSTRDFSPHTRGPPDIRPGCQNCGVTESRAKVDERTIVAWKRHRFENDALRLSADQTLVHAALDHWRTAPQHPALIRPDATSVTNSELSHATFRAGHHLIELGVKPGDTVLMSCLPSVELVIAHLAVLLIGAVAVPVNTGFTSVEVANIATESSAVLAILSDTSRWSGSVPVIDPCFLAGPAGVTSTQADVVLERVAGLTADSPAVLLFTSGTTGRPKGALLSHGNVLSSAAALVSAWEWTSHDRLVLCLPLFHMHGLGVGVHGTILAGASAVILPSFSEEAVFDAIATHQATLMFGVPTMWTRLVDHSRVQELSGLRLCVSGSAPLSTNVWNGLRDRSGQEIIERYGMTETVMLTSNVLHGPVGQTRKPGTVGVALPGVEVKLHEPGPDEVGEIVVRGPNVFSGYLNRPDANAEAFLEGGWFRTGDLGRFDEDGFLSIVGRSKDLIITGGYNVYPVDVETIMRTHSDIAEVAIVGEPSDLWGETVTACVVLRDGADPSAPTASEKLIAFAAEHLAPYQRPRKVVIMDSLPRNALGKVVKAELMKFLTNGPSGVK
jgi:malonyl-CoA/methylmalonyl-CoA synthetase